LTLDIAKTPTLSGQYRKFEAGQASLAKPL